MQKVKIGDSLDYIESSQHSLFGNKDVIGFGCFDLCVKEIDREVANDLIVKNHYSHKFYKATYIHLGVFGKGELLGVLQYGYAMNPASMASVVRGTGKDEYLELNRMWLSDELPQNSESMAISRSIKFIKRKYPKIKWIQSFADERCGLFGVVYQASNFDYYGEHKSDFWELDGEIYHNIGMTVSKDSKRYNRKTKHLQENADRAVKMRLRQFRYIYFMKKRFKKNCLLKQFNYPKHASSQRDNADAISKELGSIPSARSITDTSKSIVDV